MLKIVEGTRPVRVSVSTGDYSHAHARATGKVLLAHSTHEARDLYLQRHPLIAVTERTITDDSELVQVLDDVRTQGYALESEEYQSGVGCIAAPIFVDGHLLGAISVSVPMQRLTTSKDSLVDDVRTVAAEATDVLSGTSSTSHPRQKEMRS
ncbi:IclR family transcriptional regulator [Aeromicrobium sp. UC242_57]|uniref:IclR family transcriptional regulator n=1 Tax=Aeromicrobium sp. UC242_57 TaxID=3374624 RepID=UPI0037AAD359